MPGVVRAKLKHIRENAYVKEDGNDLQSNILGSSPRFFMTTTVFVSTEIV
jgi:hypothetical protein